jgi:hypothetical protein
MEEITSSVVLPVTDAQMAAFSTWVINTYVTYDGFQAAIKSPAIDTYIKTHILPQEMNNVLRRSERFRGEKWGDVNIQWMLLNRRRVTAKMNNLKGKIVTRTFPIEAALSRRDQRAAATIRRQAREAEQLRLEQQMQAYYAAVERRDAKVYPYPLTITKQLSAEESVMDDDCVICLSTHKMTDACTISCGHQFGITCLAKWKKDTCPLCRTKITETTVYAAPILLTDIDAVELATVEVVA